MSLLVIDIDLFKLVNDTYGHLQGDRVLVEIAELLRQNLRADDLAARDPTWSAFEPLSVIAKSSPRRVAKAVSNSRTRGPIPIHPSRMLGVSVVRAGDGTLSRIDIATAQVEGAPIPTGRGARGDVNADDVVTARQIVDMIGAEALVRTARRGALRPYVAGAVLACVSAVD